MARRVFFSFHYDDVTRANVVRNSDQIIRQYEQAARFYDKSLWEEAKKQGPLAIKRMINKGLEGSSVTCVLIGQHTWERPWVRYEILKSLLRGNGILAIHIHDVGFDPKGQGPIGELARLLANQSAAKRPSGLLPTRGALSTLSTSRGTTPFTRLGPGIGFVGRATDAPPAPGTPGRNPLEDLGYTIDRRWNAVIAHEIGPDGKWRVHAETSRTPLRTVPWLAPGEDAMNLSTLFRVYGWKQDNGAHELPTWIEDAARQVGR